MIAAMLLSLIVSCQKSEEGPVSITRQNLDALKKYKWTFEESEDVHNTKEMVTLTYSYVFITDSTGVYESSYNSSSDSYSNEEPFYYLFENDRGRIITESPGGYIDISTTFVYSRAQNVVYVGTEDTMEPMMKKYKPMPLD